VKAELGVGRDDPLRLDRGEFLQPCLPTPLARRLRMHRGVGFGEFEVPLEVPRLGRLQGGIQVRDRGWQTLRARQGGE